MSKDFKVGALSLLAICLIAPLEFGFAGIPVTLQSLVIFVCAGLMHPKTSAAVLLLYLLLGGMGVPVFADYHAGWAKLVGPTAGFLWGFLLVALFISWQVQQKELHFFNAIILIFVSHIILLIPGFIVLELQMPAVNLWPTFVGLIPGLLIKSMAGGLLLAYLRAKVLRAPEEA